jgi:hypothetical protein
MIFAKTRSRCFVFDNFQSQMFVKPLRDVRPVTVLLVERRLPTQQRHGGAACSHDGQFGDDLFGVEPTEDLIEVQTSIGVGVYR